MTLTSEQTIAITAILAGLALVIHALANWIKANSDALTARSVSDVKSADTGVEERRLILTVANGQILNAAKITALETQNSEALSLVKVLQASVDTSNAEILSLKAQLTIATELLIKANEQIAVLNTQVTNYRDELNIASNPSDPAGNAQKMTDMQTADAQAASDKAVDKPQ